MSEFFRRFSHRMCVGADPLADWASEQFVHRHPVCFPRNVPKGLFDAAESGHEDDAPSSPPEGAIDGLPDHLNSGWIQADEVWFQLLHSGLDRSSVRFEGSLTPSVGAVIGDDLEKQPIREWGTECDCPYVSDPHERLPRWLIVLYVRAGRQTFGRSVVIHGIHPSTAAPSN